MTTIACYWHGPETDHPDDYGSCLECAHIWRTEADWRADCEALAAQLGQPVKYRLLSCPLCAHDLFNAPWATDQAWTTP